MRGHEIAVLLLLFGIGAGRADAQASRPVPGSRAGDIREVYLALPVPDRAARGPVLAEFGDRLATRAQREHELEMALSVGSSRLDPRNGYLGLCLHAPERTACAGEVILTYFTQRNGDRLVVMQARDSEANHAEDYFWRLSGGRYTAVDARTVLPDLTWADFWGNQRLPAGLSPRFFREIGGLRLSWPQEGTDVYAALSYPYGLSDPRAERLLELYPSRRFESIQLLWDRQRGLFTKGRGVPPDVEEEHDHDH